MYHLNTIVVAEAKQHAQGDAQYLASGLDTGDGNSDQHSDMKQRNGDAEHIEATA